MQQRRQTPRRVVSSCSPQPPFVPRPMFRNPEFGHESSRSVDGLGRRGALSIGAPSRTGTGTPFLPRRLATTASPLMRSRSPAVSIPEGAINAATSAHARSHAGTTNVRVIAIAMLESFSGQSGSRSVLLRIYATSTVSICFGQQRYRLRPTWRRGH